MCSAGALCLWLCGLMTISSDEEAQETFNRKLAEFTTKHLGDV
jgi:hypothetical protein